MSECDAGTVNINRMIIWDLKLQLQITLQFFEKQSQFSGKIRQDLEKKGAANKKKVFINQVKYDKKKRFKINDNK